MSWGLYILCIIWKISGMMFHGMGRRVKPIWHLGVHKSNSRLYFKHFLNNVISRYHFTEYPIEDGWRIYASVTKVITNSQRVLSPVLCQIITQTTSLTVSKNLSKWTTECTPGCSRIRSRTYILEIKDCEITAILSWLHWHETISSVEYSRK